MRADALCARAPLGAPVTGRSRVHGRSFEHGERLLEIADFAQRLTEVRHHLEADRVVRREQRVRPREQVRRRQSIVAPARAAPRGGEKLGGSARKEAVAVIHGAELGKVAMGLLEVVADELLVFASLVQVRAARERVRARASSSLLRAGRSSHSCGRLVKDPDPRRGDATWVGPSTQAERCFVTASWAVTTTSAALVDRELERLRPRSRRGVRRSGTRDRDRVDPDRSAL